MQGNARCAHIMQDYVSFTEVFSPAGETTDRAVSRGGHFHRFCFTPGTECATRLSLNFGRIMYAPAENSFSESRNR